MENRTAIAQFQALTFAIIIWIFLLQALDGKPNLVGASVFVNLMGFFLIFPAFSYYAAALMLGVAIDANAWKGKLILTTATAMVRLASMFNQVHELIPQNPFTVGKGPLNFMLGCIFYQRQELTLAKKLLRETLKELRAKDDKTSTRTSTTTVLAEILLQTGEFAESDELSQEALTLLEEEISVEERVRDDQLCSLGSTLMTVGLGNTKQGRVDKGLEYLEAALTKFRLMDQSQLRHSLEGGALNNLSVAYVYAGEYEKALATAEAALKHKLDRGGTKICPTIASGYINLADVHLAIENYDEALKNALEGKQIIEALGLVHDNAYAVALQNVADAKRGKLEFGDASELLHKAVQIKEKKVPHNDPDWVSIYCDLGKLHRDMDDFAKAEEYFELSLKCSDEYLGPHHPSTARVCEQYARSLHKAGRSTEGAKMQERVESIKKLRNRLSV